MTLNRREAILELRRAYGQHISEKPTLEVPKAEEDLALELVSEEFIELTDAITSRNLIEIADAIADIQVVLEQMALLYGINTDRVFREVHRSNLSKLNSDGTVSKDENGKVIKPAHYRRPDVEAALANSDLRADRLDVPDVVVAPSVALANRILSTQAPDLAHLLVLTPMAFPERFQARKVYMLAGVKHDRDYDEIMDICDEAVAEHPQGEVIHLNV